MCIYITKLTKNIWLSANNNKIVIPGHLSTQFDLEVGIYVLERAWEMLFKFSVCKSSYKTGKRPRLDWTTTDQDWKFARPIKTITAVQSSVLYHLGN